MKLAWATDLHLDECGDSEAVRQSFLRSLRDVEADALLIAGDTGIGSTVFNRLQEIQLNAPRHRNAWRTVPVYFVLGNHDYYDMWIEQQHRLARQLVYPRWLGAGGSIELDGMSLVGVDGWGDFSCGNRATQSKILDCARIYDFKYGGNEPYARSKAAAVDAQTLRRALESCQASTIVVLTHVPPFPDGKEDWELAPYYVCKATGDVIWAYARQHPDRQLVVLCGHSHRARDEKSLPNLRIITGAATYGVPALQPILEL